MPMSTTGIRKLNQDNQGRWHWEVHSHDWGVLHCRTNTHGDGVWNYQKSGTINGDGSAVMEWKQVVGNCQFSLNGKSMSAARSYLWRQHATTQWYE